MKKEKVEERFTIHYYFDDETHTMNAFIRNKAEKNILDAITRISKILEYNLVLETEAHSEGGMIENLIMFGGSLHYMSPSLNNLVQYYFSGGKKKQDLENKKIEIEIKKLEAETKKTELSNQKEERELLLEDKEALRHISSFYKQMLEYKKVKRIGYRDVNNNTFEKIVEREEFENFIIKENKDIEVDDNASIEIISPILKRGSFHWKGFYNDIQIDFTMGDSKFKEEIINGKHTFSNGSLIVCKLQITTVFDEFGEKKRRSYSVQKVYATKELDSNELILRESGRKKEKAIKQKEKDSKQKSLFDT